VNETNVGPIGFSVAVGPYSSADTNALNATIPAFPRRSQAACQMIAKLIYQAIFATCDPMRSQLKS
jgi:hypothetical protein